MTKKKSSKIHFQRGCATRVQFTWLERFRRQIHEENFLQEHPKAHTFSQNIDQRNLYFRMMGRESIPPVHRSLFYMGGQTSRLNLFSSLLPGWRPTEFPPNFPLIFACTLLSDEDEAITSAKDELTRHSSDSFIRFLFESPQSLARYVDDSELEATCRFCPTINMVSHLSPEISLTDVSIVIYHKTTE